MIRKLLRCTKGAASLFLITCLGSGLFLALRPEGEFSAAHATIATSDAPPIKLLTWNILRSAHEEPLGRPWAIRKSSYAALMKPDAYDIVCLQEALPEQIEFFSSLLPRHQVYRVGRDDGKSCGEHCPIFFNSERFTLRDSGTFWLSPTPDTPGCSWGESCPRICSWVELQEKGSAQPFRVYNIHLHLNPIAQPKAAEVLRQRLAKVKIPVIVAGDFNAPHKWPAMKILYGQGLTEADAGQALTYHVAGKGIRCLDHVLTDANWAVANGGILKAKGGEAYPSDHFGLWVDVRPTVAALSAVR